MKPLLSILVPTFNGWSRIQTLLLSFYRHGYIGNTNIEIIIADNNSTDNSFHLLSTYRQDFQSYCNYRNIGFEGSVIALLHKAKGQYFWILGDDDCIGISASEIIHIIGECSKPSCFISYPEHFILQNLDKLESLMFEPRLPFGYIASSIFPLNSSIIELFENHLEHRHQSPQFFAKLEYVVKHNLNINVLPNYLLENHIQCRDQVSFLKRQKKVKVSDGLFALKPWREIDYMKNWFFGLKYSKKKVACGSLPSYTSSLISNYINSHLYESVKIKGFYFYLYWIIRAPFLIVKSPYYWFFIISRLSKLPFVNQAKVLHNE